MILNNLFPIFILIILGTLLKTFKITHDAFLKTSDRLVYFILFPLLLFWKIGGAPASITTRDLCLATACALLSLYLLSLIFIKIRGVEPFQAGAFSQTCYRFNTYVGMAVVMSGFGEAGVRHFGVMVGIAIPLVNVFSVSTLIWFSGQSYSPLERVRITLEAVVANPLILACVAGILYSSMYFYLYFLFQDFNSAWA